MSERKLLVFSAFPLWPVLDGYTLRVCGLLGAIGPEWRTSIVAPEGGEHERERSPLGSARRIILPVSLAQGNVTSPAKPQREEFRRFARKVIEAEQPAIVLLCVGAEFIGFHERTMAPFVADRIDCLGLACWRSLRSGGTGLGRWRKLRSLFELLRYERRIVRSMAATVVVGEDDARLLRRISGRSEVHVVPNGVRVSSLPNRTEKSPRPTVTFTGVMDYPPNVEAVLWFDEHVWPSVRKSVPDAELVVAGRRPTPTVLGLHGQRGITVVSDIPEMRDILAAAWVAVAPMVSGSGIKNKVLEAWASATPVVMTPMAANGLSLDSATAACVTDTPGKMAEAIVRLLSSKEERERLGRAAYALAESRHSWVQAARRLSLIMEEAIERHEPKLAAVRAEAS